MKLHAHGMMRVPASTGPGVAALPRTVLAAALIACPVFSSFAQEAPEPQPLITPDEAGYSVTRFSVVDGLPIEHVTSLAQTPDGYLWIGSIDGLIRYDGNRFHLFPPGEIPELKNFEIIELHCDQAGRLWIGAINNTRLVVYEKGRFRNVPTVDGINFREPSFVDGPNGEVWIRHHNSANSYRYRDGRLEVVEQPNLKPGTTDRFLLGEGGLTWTVRQAQPEDDGPGRAMLRISEDGAEHYPLLNPDGDPELTLGRFFTLQDGRKAITSTHAIYVLEGEDWKIHHPFPYRIGRPIGDGATLDTVEDNSGNYWIAHYAHGLTLSTPGGATARVALPGPVMTAFHRHLLVDTEGNIWVAGTEGLFRFRRQHFQQITLSESTKSLDTKAVIEDSSGGFWIGHSEGWSRRVGAEWQFTPHGQIAEHSSIMSMAAGAGGTVYLGYQTRTAIGAPGFVEKIHPDGRRERLGSIEGQVFVLLETRDETLWVGGRGLWRWNGSKLVREAIGEPDGWVYGLAETREGALFAAVGSDGLFRRDGDSWQRLTTPEDRLSQEIRTLTLDPDGETLWMTAGGALSRWKDGKWLLYPRYSRAVYFTGIVADASGGVWLGSRIGIFRASRTALARWEEGSEDEVSYEWFDRTDGLPDGAVTSAFLDQSAFLRDSSGRLWMSIDGGVVRTDPTATEKLGKSLPPPPIHLEAVLVDDQDPTEGAQYRGVLPESLELVPGRHRVEFRFTAINLSAYAKSRFRYRLTGLDSDWIDAGERREAVYHDLAPGTYRFEVIAENKNGVWSDSPASISMVVPPHWWQRTSVHVAAVLLLALLGTSAYRIRTDHLKKRHTQQENFSRQLIEAQEEERKRIAGELHDDVGQDLLVIKSRLDSGEDVPRAAEDVASVIGKMRALSHSLRPIHLERLGLSSAMRNMAAEVSESIRIPIETELDDISGLLSPDSIIGLYRILQESLNNMVKHSDASEVHVSLKRETSSIMLSVTDDGRGFDPATMQTENTNTHGLAGMRERCHLMGGRFEVTSTPGVGTTVRVMLPIAES